DGQGPSDAGGDRGGGPGGVAGPAAAAPAGAGGGGGGWRRGRHAGRRQAGGAAMTPSVVPPLTDALYVWLAIVALAACSALTRSSFLLLGDYVPLPERVRRALRYAPAAALVA